MDRGGPMGALDPTLVPGLGGPSRHASKGNRIDWCSMHVRDRRIDTCGMRTRSHRIDLSRIRIWGQQIAPAACGGSNWPGPNCRGGSEAPNEDGGVARADAQSPVRAARNYRTTPKLHL